MGAPPQSRARIRFHHDYRGLAFPQRRLESIARRVYAREKVSPERALDVVLCSDYRIRRLNAAHRSKDRATDVLAFPFEETDYLGEIYISLQRCAVDARRFGLTYDEEVERVFVHGLVHLLGYDHGPAMEEKEKRYRTFSVD